MKIGFIGLGRMGFNMVQNLLDKKHEVVAFDMNEEVVSQIANDGAIGVRSIKEMASELSSPRVFWVMVPSGKPVDMVFSEIMKYTEKGDIIIDGGNSKYTDSVAREKELSEKGLNFLDVGTSGGLDGARNGACMMIGGEQDIFASIEPIFKDMCVVDGYGYVGEAGSGHFVKMVHNGVEYGMMQAIGEGFELLEKSPFNLDFKDVSKIWANGSVIRSWLIDLIHEAFTQDITLKEFDGPVGDSGEGKWTLEAALNYKVAVPAIAASVWERYRSRECSPLTDKAVSAMREGFGRHVSGNKQ